MEAIHYVYEWVRPDYGVVFYVGKGSGDRAWDFNRNQKHLMNIVQKLQSAGKNPEVRILARFVSTENAFDFEMERIAYWSPLGELVNKTNGGDGVRGYKWTIEQRSNHYMKNPETRNDNRLFKSGRENPMFGIASYKHPFFGKTHTNETREILRRNKIGVRPAHAKFTREQVFDILNDGRASKYIAEDYRCSGRAIRYIKEGKSYKDIYKEWVSSKEKDE